jgi:serine/threonine protein kinase
VYKGLQFAVKVFDRPDRAGWRHRFMREVNFLRACDHPSIMRVYDEGEDAADRPFIVMEYLPQTLRDRRRERLSNIEKVSYTLQLLSALRYLAHLDPPVVHRDIKPRTSS